MTNPDQPPAHRDALRIAFLELGAAFFGLAVLERVLGLFGGFSSLVLTVFLTWLLVFLISPLISALERRLPLGRGLAVALLATIVLVVSQTILVNAIQPRPLREGVGLHPILVIVALLVGSQVAGLWGAIFGVPFVAIVNLLLRYLIDARAVNAVEGIELDEVVAAIQAEHPEVEVEEAVAMAADHAEAMLDTDSAAQESNRARRRWVRRAAAQSWTVRSSSCAA